MPERRWVLGAGLGRGGAAAVLCGLRHVPPRRPVPWAARVRALEALGGHIVRSLMPRGGPTPSWMCSVTEDAVAIACLAGAPVFVRPALLGRRRRWHGPA